MEQTPWYLEVVMPALLRHARTTYGKAMRAALDEAGFDDIPANGLYLIGALAMDGTQLREVVRSLGTSKQAASQLVESLVMRGYLERATDPDDRRQMIVTLTGRGRDAAQVQANAREAIDAELVERVGRDCYDSARRALGTLIDMRRDAAA